MNSGFATTSAKKRPARISAWLVAAGCVALINEWTVALLFAPDGRLPFEGVVAVRVLDGCLLLWGLSAFRHATKLRLAALAHIAVVLVSVAVALEFSLALALRYPTSWFAKPVQPIAKQLYSRWRRVVQYDPACAQHHPKLGYILRPGTCTFENVEFSTTFEINSHGLRDDDESLKKPQVRVGGLHGDGLGRCPE